MRDFKLYLILDLGACGTNIITIAKKAISAGADIVQLRAKQSSLKYILKVIHTLKPVFYKYSVSLIINDRVDLAMAIDASGVHLGQDDLPIKLARKLLGSSKIIGVSCHNLRQAMLAQKQGADYISLGPIFSTPTKPEYKKVGVGLIRKSKDKIRIPFVAIGGINHKNIKDVMAAGAKRIAVCRAICRAKNIIKSTRGLKLMLSKN